MPNKSETKPLLEVISDTICPWCYIGKRRLEAALEMLRPANSIEVRYRPFQLNPEMPVGGIERREYRTKKFGSWERSLELDAQVNQAGLEIGIEFHQERALRTPNTLASHALLELAHAAGKQVPVAEAVFRAYFTEGRDIGDPAVLADIGEECRMPRPEVLAGIQDDELRATVHAESLRASREGVSGVPTFRIAGRVLFSGAQPPAVIAQALSRTAPY